MKKILISLIITILVIWGIFNLKPTNDISLRGLNTNVSNCTPTQSIVTVGDDITSVLLATSSKRAWATISQPANATNTTAVSFGADATIGGGLILQNASTTNGRTFVQFGLATDFPYTGYVAGITSTGSTTVQVIQCNFN